MKKSALLLALLAVVIVSAGTAAAQSQPASKATFAFKELISLPACAPARVDCADNSDWQTILTQQIKMANQKDLFIDASLQCGIVTDTTVKSMNGSLDSSEARATIRVRVKITPPVGDPFYAEPDAGVDATNTADAEGAGVVYCDRIQTLKAKFSGLNCTADLTTGAVSCADPEELELILKTLNANSFNFVAADLVSGVHKIEVQARSSAATASTGTNGSLGNANAFIGAGSVAIEAVRMIKGEQVEF